MDGIKRLFFLAGCALLLTPPVGHATDHEPRTYAVLSLIGDKISIVGHEVAVAGRVDRNQNVAIESLAEL